MIQYKEGLLKILSTYIYVIRGQYFFNRKSLAFSSLILLFRIFKISSIMCEF